MKPNPLELASSGVGPLMRILVFFTLSALFSLVPSFAQPPPGEPWIQLESDHFHVMSNAGPEEAVHVATDLEAICAVMAQLTPGLVTVSPVPTWVVVFKDTRSFDPYRLGAKGKPENVAGYFQEGSDGNYVCIDASGGQSASQIAHHEFVHILLSANFRNVPVWLSEGLAEYYSTIELVNDTARIGRPVAEHVKWLSQNELLRIDELFAVTLDSPDYHEGNRQGVFYAQSWALTHYLMSSGEADLQRAGTLLAAIDRGATVENALSSIIPFDALSLRSRLAKYVKQNSFEYLEVALPQSVKSRIGRPLTMRRPDVLFRLGDLLAHRGQEQGPAAERLLRLALDTQPAFSGPLVSLGIIAERQGNLEEAARWFRQAIETDSTDWRAQYFMGLNAFSKIGAGSADTAEVVKLPDLAQRYLRHSLKLNPRFAPSRALLGKTFLVRGDPSPEGIALLTEAVKEMPSRLDVLVDLILMTARAGGIDDARHLLDDRLRPSGDKEMIELAETQLEHWRWYRERSEEIVRFNEAIRLNNRGELDSALALFVSLSDAASDSTIQREARQAAGNLRHSIQRRRAIDRYHEGVEAAKRGDLSKARGIFQSVLQMNPDKDLRNVAADALHLVEKAQSGHN